MIGALLAAATGVASPLVVVADRQTGPHGEAIAALSAVEPQAEVLAPDSAAIAVRAGQDATWIALGARSAAALRGVGAPARAAALVRFSDVPTGVAAVTLDVPVAEQLDRIRRAFPGRHRIIVLRKPGGAVDDASLRRACEAREAELVLVDVERPGEAVAALQGSLRGHLRHSLLWLLPDPTAVNGDTTAPLIRAALAAGIPTVGFSPYFLRVGAVAAVSIDYGAAARQALELARRQAATVAPPATWSLVINERLAGRLGIVVARGEGIGVQP